MTFFWDFRKERKGLTFLQLHEKNRVVMERDSNQLRIL